jgi:hypothetical protein
LQEEELEEEEEEETKGRSSKASKSKASSRSKSKGTAGSKRKKSQFIEEEADEVGEDVLLFCRHGRYSGRHAGSMSQ